MILAAIKDILFDESSVVNLVGDRVYVNNLPQGQFEPSIEMRIPDDKMLGQPLVGPSQLHKTLVVIDCTANDQLKADQICRAIETCGIIGYVRTSDAVKIHGIVCHSSGGQDYEKPYPGQETRRYVTTIVLEVCWQYI